MKPGTPLATWKPDQKERYSRIADAIPTARVKIEGTSLIRRYFGMETKNRTEVDMPILVQKSRTGTSKAKYQRMKGSGRVRSS